VAGAIAVCVAVAWVAAAASFASGPDPQKAASVLVVRLEAQSKREHVTTFAASKVVARHGLWLAFGSTPTGAPFSGGGPAPTSVRIYRWSGRAWDLSGVISGALGPSQWIYAATLTGSADPDFAIEGCGAGDNNCLSVVSDVGGKWHAVPFEYGYGTSLEVNGIPGGEFGGPASGYVGTEVDACGCAGGPSTWTDERYQNGVFEPTFGPGPQPDCSASTFASLADFWTVQVLQFDHVACAGGWALALGTGAGFSGPVVGLFERGSRQDRWQVLTLDNGTALPGAPALYDLPLSLLVRLASNLGAPLTPEIAAAKLIAYLQGRYHFYWPGQEGIVPEAGTDWLIALLPTGRAPNDYTAPPQAVVIYRWSGTRWTVAGRVAHLPASMNIAGVGGWFVPAHARGSSAIAFRLGSVPGSDNSLITNEGGIWHTVVNG
jgi:hypothetical protein